MNRKKLYWILQISGAMAYTIINLILYLVTDNLEASSIIYAITLSGWFLLSTHIFRYYIKKHNWVNLKITRLLPAVLVATFMLSIIKYCVHILVADSLGRLDYDSFWGPWAPSTVILFLVAYMVYYVTWALLYFMYHYFERYNTSLKYEATKNEMELNKLKSQLNPHFIFNALNSIRALVDEDPGKAKNAITQLSSILRSSLVMNKNKLTHFSEEMNAVKDYLALESIRFEERLQTEFKVDPESNQFLVPPLMIQTLVENGIKHGISHLKEGGKISLSTEVKDASLIIRIRNDGQMINGMPKRPKGFGIDNTKQRLQLIFGDKATFKIYNDSDKTVMTEIKLPKNI